MNNQTTFQITLDNNSNVTGYSKGDGIIPGGITVESIPDNVQANYLAYKYIEGEFVYNKDYVQIEQKEQNASPQPTIAELQTEITALKEQNTLLESCVMQLADTVYAV